VLKILLTALLPCCLGAQVSILRITVVSGEAAVHPPGTRVARPLTIEVRDEIGQPVQGAAVSFHFPEDGPGGLFANGLPTDLAVTDAAGRATVRGFQLNRTTGAIDIRITAAKDQARAGTLVKVFIGDAKSVAATRPEVAASPKPARLIEIQPTPEPKPPPSPVPTITAGVPVESTPAASKPTSSRPTGLPTVIIHEGRSRSVSTPTARARRGSRKKWVVLGMLAAGGAAGAFAGRSMSAANGSGPSAAASTAASVSIGNPTISIGKP
jgi:hypothetical protein